MYIYIYVYIDAYIHTHICTHHTNEDICTIPGKGSWSQLLPAICMRMCSYIHAPINIYMCTYVHTQIHTNT